MTKELTTKPEKQITSVEEMMTSAIASGATVETLERLMALRKEMNAEIAKKAFDEALSAFQAECPIIYKTKSVSTNSGAHAYSFAPLEVIIDKTKELRLKHGFSFSVSTETNEINVRAICTIKHILGHSESSSFEVPLGNKTGVMSQTQVVASAITFAKRYAFTNAFGINIADEDFNTLASKSTQDDVEAVKEYITAIKATKTMDELKKVWEKADKLKLVKDVVDAKNAQIISLKKNDENN